MPPKQTHPCLPCQAPPKLTATSSELTKPHINTPRLPQLDLPCHASSYHALPQQAVPALPRWNMPHLTVTLPTRPNLPNQTSPAAPSHNISRLTSPPVTQPAFPGQACRGYSLAVATWKVPKEPSLEGLHSPTPLEKPPIFSILSICSGLIAPAL